MKEVEAEKKAKGETEEEEEENDGIVRDVMGVEVPQWIVGFQLALAEAGDRIEDFIDTEVDAKVWNYTKAEGGPPPELNPAYAPDSPEVAEAGAGLDFGASTCEGLVLSPYMFSAFLKYADPLYNEEKDLEERKNRPKRKVASAASATIDVDIEDVPMKTALSNEEELLEKLADLRSRTRERLEKLEERLNVD